MLSSYFMLKFFHLVAVVLFLGNTTLGLFWVAHAERTKDVRLIAHAMDGIIRSDRWFTWPGVILILSAGIGAAAMGHMPLLRAGWIAWSIGFFTFSGLVFGFWLAPLQKRIAQYATSPEVDISALQILLKRWHMVGWLSLLPLWLAMATMVFKYPL